jgi:O-antigen/teichoic acid export membrane protein
VKAKEFIPQAGLGAELNESLVRIEPLCLGRGRTLDAGRNSVMRGLPLRSNFVWILTGNVVYAVCQWGMIVALAKLGSSVMIGQFSLALAIATPVLMFTNLHLRAVQATDAQRFYSFTEYLELRLVMTLTAMLVIAGIIWCGHYERRTAMVIVAVALAKGIETLSDIHYGLFQLNDRLDQTGQSLMLRGLLSVVALSAGLYLTRDVFYACIGLALVWLAALLFFDVRRGRCFVGHSAKSGRPLNRTGWWRPTKGNRRGWSLLRLALPLGIVTTLVSINLNMPRYFIQARMGEHQLGVFSAMAYATVAITLISDSLGHCAIPRMSRLYAGGYFVEFRALLLKLLAVGGVLGLTGLAVVHVMGATLLTIFYSSEYAVHSQAFTLLVLATAIHCVACMLTSGIMSARCFKIQVPMFAIVAGSNALACARWVPKAGIVGGAVATATSAAVHLVLAALVLGYLLLTPSIHVIARRKPPLCDHWEPSV